MRYIPGSIALACLILTVTLLASCSHGPPVPFKAFDFNVEDLFTGEAIHLEDYSGRPVLIYFFASW